jgi:hypothetical protein
MRLVPRIRISWVCHWGSDAILEMLRPFVGHLPDMDLVFNTHDEPSVVFPNDVLTDLVRRGRTSQSASFQSPFPLADFCPRPLDLVDTIPGHYGTSVIHISRQTAWTFFIQSCPPNSPVRQPEGARDLTALYFTPPLGFIHNTTAFSDVCNNPALPLQHGFFDLPNSMQLTAHLLPIFSAGKVSSFNDILFPSQWVYTERTAYDNKRDMDWKLKQNQLHWRGQSSTGYSVHGGWRRHHRQPFLAAMDRIKSAVPILKKLAGTGWIPGVWAPADAQPFFDVKFTSISDYYAPEDVEEQR